MQTAFPFTEDLFAHIFADEMKATKGLTESLLERSREFARYEKNFREETFTPAAFEQAFLFLNLQISEWQDEDYFFLKKFDLEEILLAMKEFQKYLALKDKEAYVFVNSNTPLFSLWIDRIGDRKTYNFPHLEWSLIFDSLLNRALQKDSTMSSEELTWVNWHFIYLALCELRFAVENAR